MAMLPAKTNQAAIGKLQQARALQGSDIFAVSQVINGKLETRNTSLSDLIHMVGVLGGAPVTRVCGQTGDVILSLDDITGLREYVQSSIAAVFSSDNGQVNQVLDGGYF